MQSPAGGSGPETGLGVNCSLRVAEAEMQLERSRRKARVELVVLAAGRDVGATWAL